MSSIATSFHGKIDEISRDSNLRSNVAELAPHPQEQIILLPKGARIHRCRRDLSLERLLIRVGDFGKGRKEEEDDQKGNEAGDSEVNPLDVLQPSLGVDRVREENAGGEEWRYEGPDALDGLCQVETDLAVPWRTANGKESDIVRKYLLLLG